MKKKCQHSFPKKNHSPVELQDKVAFIAFFKKHLTSREVFIFIGCVLILLTRLPQFFGEMLFPDGDECIVGLMAKHILDGKGFPLFVYGNPYGFAVFETVPAALFYKIFGVSAVSLKTAVLCLWTTGWIFFVLTLWRLENRRIAMIGGLLLLFSPGWGAMSLKAWGTHVTAFTAMNLSLWIMAVIYRSKDDCKTTALLLGCSLAIVILSNPIWLFAVFPFVVLLIYERRKMSDIVFMALGTIGLAAIILLVKLVSGGIDHHWVPLIFTNWDILEAIRLLPERVWVAMSGAYFLTDKLDAGEWTFLTTGVWTISSLLFLGWMAAGLFRKAPVSFLIRGFIGVIFTTLALSLFINNEVFGYRYFLPLISSFIALITVGIDRLWNRGRVVKISAQMLLALLIFTGVVSLSEFRHLSSSGVPPEAKVGEAKAIENLTGYLLNQGINSVYSFDRMLHWQIMFASKEDIKARWFHPSDRYPEYPRAVDKAFASNNKVALVGYTNQMALLAKFLVRRDTFPRVEESDGWYVIIYDPDRALLEEIGFVLNQ
jgi:hypothetical protein